MFFGKKKEKAVLRAEHVWVYCFNPSYEELHVADPVFRVFKTEEECVEAMKEDVLELDESFFMEEKADILPTTKVNKMVQFLESHNIYCCMAQKCPIEKMELFNA